MFKFVGEAFDAVARGIEILVVRRFLATGAERGNDRLNAVLGETRADAIGIATFVEGGKLQDVVRVEACVERFKLLPVVGLASRQVERDRTVFVEGGRVAFRAPAPARAAQRLVAAVFFGAPAACGCARTLVESRSRPRALAKGTACRFFHRRCQTPRASQRRKRI